MSKKATFPVLNVMTEEHENSADIYLYGVIGQEPSLYYGPEKEDEDLTARKIVKAIKAMEKKYDRINIRVNGPGGFISEGDPVIAAIMNSPAEITTYNDGLAASMTANIWLAGKKREMATNAKLMFHNSMGIAVGNAKEMRETADMLDKFDEAMINTMVELTGMSEEETRQRFYNYRDNWMTKKDAEEMGLLNGDQEYESQAEPPSNLTNMTYEQILDSYKEENNEQGIRLLGKIQQLWSNMTASAAKPEKSSKMNKTELINSLKTGEISTDEVADVLRNEGFQVQQPAPEPSDVDRMQNAITAAMKPLADKIAAMEQQVQALGAKPADAPAAAGADDDPQNTDPLTPEDQVLAEANKAFQNAWNSNVSVQFV